MARTVQCLAGTRAGRLGKAVQFAEAAETIAAFAEDEADVSDAYVTLLVHAGIAASDLLCCARLGVHAVGENHNEAIGLLQQVDRALARDLQTLLAMKTKAGYSHRPTSTTDRARADRAASRLVTAAREVR